MKYLCLIYADNSTRASWSKGDIDKMMAEYGEFTASIKKSGHYIGGERLEAVTAASTVRVRNGKTTATDGPFAETKEQLGGFYLIEAKDLNEAISIGARIPGAKVGSIEVRPVAPTNVPAGVA
jgi:hypothetical protein